MAAPVIMPRQGQSVESCIIAKWHKSKGDKVHPGDILFTYETDKATFDEEAKVEGTMLEIFFEEGDDVPCLVNVCVIGDEGESGAEFNPNAEQSGQAEEKHDNAEVKKEKEPGEMPVLNTGNEISGDGDVKVSPRARNMAERAGVDYRLAGGTGPQGRIIERDIVSLRENGPVLTSAARSEYMSMEGAQLPAGTGLGGRITTADLSAPVNTAAGMPVQSSESKPAYEEVKLTNIRKVIAKVMHHSISSTCQLTLNTSFDATEILAYRRKLKEGSDRLKLENITLNDIILYTVSRTILRHRDLNAHFLDDRMLYFNNVNLGVAVDTERGLMVPTVFNANLKSLNEISSDVKRLAEECQKGTVSPDLLKGGSFTISNLGTMDIESFTPVLNAPQTGILGVNTIIQRMREVKGEYVYYPAMGLSLTFDHRALDGAPAARFLQDLKSGLENFSVLLAK